MLHIRFRQNRSNTTATRKYIIAVMLLLGWTLSAFAVDGAPTEMSKPKNQSLQPSESSPRQKEGHGVMSKNWYDRLRNFAPLRNRQLSSSSDEISPPVTTIRMIAVPPRDRLPGSTKGLPYKVRIINKPRKRSVFQSVMSRRQLFTTDLDSSRVSDGDDETKPVSYTVDLHGGIVGVGEYFSVIEIGGKKIRVQVDTGSSTLAVSMRGCSSCIKKANRYAVEESHHATAVSCNSRLCAADRCTTSCAICSERGACCSSERPEHCGFSLRYADGSAASGSLIQDQVQWGSLRTNLTFGGILRNSPNFERPEVDGILGMAYKSLACNPSCFDPPFDSFVKEGLVQDVFSICMTATGGKLMLGGYDAKVAKTRVRYIPLQHSGAERYYRITLGGSLLVGEERVSLPNFQVAIVDTGTTLLVTSTRTFATLKEHFQKKYCMIPELCGSDSWFQSGMCVSLSERDLGRLPALTLTVGGRVRLVLRPRDYMLSYSRGGKTYRCVGIMGMDGLGGMVVLGNTLMQRYVTVYDRRNARLGFAEAAEKCGDK